MSVKKIAQEQGFVSIIVASILMVIMTLITLGFTQIMQREQRQALDRQLNTQAYYAAESAINDFDVLLTAYNDRPELYPEFGTPEGKEKTDCDTSGFPNEGKIDGEDGDISYTCLQYDLDPVTIEFNNGTITTDQSKVFPVSTTDGADIQSIELGWEHQTPEGNYNLSKDCNQNAFPATRVNQVPVMRVDILRIPKDGEYDQRTLINETPNLYLNPKDGCGVTSIKYEDHNSPSKKGQIVQVNCSASQDGRDCKLTIDMTGTGSIAATEYILRLRSIYANASATISAVDTSGNQAELKDAQVLVDATGKANDVVRRIQVRLKAKSVQSIERTIPEPVFQSMSGFCKTLTVQPPGSFGVQAGGSVELDPGGLCSP